MNICAGIVTYNPNITILKKCIESVEGQVDKIVIVDNDSKNRMLIENIICDNE